MRSGSGFRARHATRLGWISKSVVASTSLPLCFAQTDTRSPPVFIDEFDADRFQSSTDDVKRGPSGRVTTCLKLADCHNAYPCMLCQIHLAPLNQTTRRSALGWSEHSRF